MSSEQTLQLEAMSSEQTLRLEVAKLRQELEATRRERDVARRMCRILQQHNNDIICAMSSTDVPISHVDGHLSTSCVDSLPLTPCVEDLPLTSCVGDSQLASCARSLPPTSCVGQALPASCAGDQLSTSCVDLPSTSCVGDSQLASCARSLPPTSCVGKVLPASCAGDRLSTSCVDLSSTSCVGDYQLASCAGNPGPASCAGMKSLASCAGAPSSSSSEKPSSCVGGDQSGLPLSTHDKPSSSATLHHSTTAPTSRATDRGWLKFTPSQPADAIILSDSLMRAVDSDSFGRQVDLWALSGLRIDEAIEILRHWEKANVRCEELFICVGVNDINRANPGDMREHAQLLKKTSLKVGARVTLCNVPDSLWRNQSSNVRRRSLKNRKMYNQAIYDVAKGNKFVSVIDLERVFAGHGCPPNKGIEWYHRDAIHPNTAGTIAIESCVRQALMGQPIIPPKDGDAIMKITAGEFDRRRSLINTNYGRFTTPGKKRSLRD